MGLTLVFVREKGMWLYLKWFAVVQAFLHYETGLAHTPALRGTRVRLIASMAGLPLLTMSEMLLLIDSPPIQSFHDTATPY